MMGTKPFQFKQFTVLQDHATHKVGTDGVLLGAWLEIRDTDKSILDIGSGTGLIALMLAQRTSPHTSITGIEIDARDAQQAAENVSASPWPAKISIRHTSLQKFFPEQTYDLIVSNPPYFMNSWLPPDDKRRQARHTGQLSFAELLQNSVRLLREDGRLAVILPRAEGLQFVNLARGYKLFPVRRTSFRSRVNKPVERLLIEFAYAGEPARETELILYSEGTSWSAEYSELMKGFYLKG
jgi:tRNA1Val (adenine37-N6)-methyltransferase